MTEINRRNDNDEINFSEISSKLDSPESMMGLARSLSNKQTKLLKEALDIKHISYAPEGFHRLFRKISPAKQKKIVDHFTFYEDHIEAKLVIEREPTIIRMDTKNISVDPSKVKKGEVEIHDGETYFSYDALMQHAEENGLHIPSEEVYDAMLRLMPASDYTLGERSKVAAELGVMLKIRLLGGINEGKLHSVGDVGSLWTATPHKNTGAAAFTANSDNGRLVNFRRSMLFPARAIKIIDTENDDNENELHGN